MKAKPLILAAEKPKTGIIHWQKSAKEINNLIRAVTDPFPGAFTFGNGKKIIIWGAKGIPELDENKPGKVLSLNPLVISTGKGSLNIIKGKVGEKDNLSAESIVKEAGLTKDAILG